MPFHKPRITKVIGRTFSLSSHLPSGMVVEEMLKAFRAQNIILDRNPRFNCLSTPERDSRSHWQCCWGCSSRWRSRHRRCKGTPASRALLESFLARRPASLQDFAAELIGGLATNRNCRICVNPSLLRPPKMSDNYGTLEGVTPTPAANFVTQKAGDRTVKQFRDKSIANNNHNCLSTYNLRKLKLAVEHQQVEIVARIDCGAARQRAERINGVQN